DVDDLIPTLVAFQIEWNKLRVRQRAAGWPPDSEPSPEECAHALGGSSEDWARLRAAWGARFYERLRMIAERSMNLRVRMHGGTQVGYARMTRRWWTPSRPSPASASRYSSTSWTRSHGRTSSPRSCRPSARAAPRARGRTSST